MHYPYDDDASTPQLQWLEDGVNLWLATAVQCLQDLAWLSSKLMRWVWSWLRA